MLSPTKLAAATLWLIFAGCTQAPPPPADWSTVETVPREVGPEALVEEEIPVVETEETAMNEKTKKPLEYNALTEIEEYVILHKGTERRYVGKYTDLDEPGTYICRQCNAPLYKSDHKFHSDCGWPAFDDEIEGAVDRHTDADGYRIEIVCHQCGGHLGHVFRGEGFTPKNVRHCVNSVSMTFIPAGTELPPVGTQQRSEPK